MNLFTLVGKIAIENSEANREIDETTEKAKGLSSSLTGIGDAADKSEEKLRDGSKFGAASVWLGNMLTSLTNKAVGLGKSLISVGFDFNASIETYQAQFSALLGSEEDAKNLVDDIRELAKISPLNMQGLAKNATHLLATGVELADVIPTLQMLGNISLGEPEKMDRVVTAYLQIMSKQKLYAEEIMQLNEAGI